MARGDQCHSPLMADQWEDLDPHTTCMDRLPSFQCMNETYPRDDLLNPWEEILGGVQRDGWGEDLPSHHTRVGTGYVMLHVCRVSFICMYMYIYCSLYMFLSIILNRVVSQFSCRECGLHTCTHTYISRG